MKKILILILATLMSCVLLTACQTNTNDDVQTADNSDDNVIVVKISDEANQFQNGSLKSDGAKGILGEGVFEKILFYLCFRDGEQSFPECEVTNKLESFVCEGSEVYTLSKENYENIVLYIHGGGWAFEIGTDHIQFCDKLVDTLNAKVYMPLYPLTPEADSEETYAMIESLYKELLKEGKNIYLMGDSAGGNISLGLAYTIKQENLTAPEKMVLIAPCSDMSFSNAEIEKINETDPVLDLYGCSRLAKIWAGEDHLKDPKNSALYADVTGYPDTLLFQGTNDILCPDNLLFYQHMKDAGVNITMVKGEGLWHVYPIDSIPEREESLKIIKEFCLD